MKHTLLPKFLIYCLSLLFNLAIIASDPYFFVVIPTYHNKDYCIKNIESLAEQSYQNWQAVIIVDGSAAEDDGTYALLHQYITDNQLSNRIKLIQNTERRLALYNIYNAIHTYAEDDWIVALYDGDDFFTTPKALERIAEEYQKPTTWFTYGQYINYPKYTEGICQPFPAELAKSNAFRNYRWIASHPRTFYAWLFKQIHLQDFLHNGKFFPMAWDVAFLPMLEMAGTEHIAFIPDILYAYRHHQNNDYAINYPLQAALEKIIRSQKRYKKLACKPEPTSVVKTADLIIYSKDRPLQLEALLDSIEYHVTGLNEIKIIYKASSKEYENAFTVLKKRYPRVTFINEGSQKGLNFKKLTLKTLEQCTAQYIIFAVDDNLVTSPLNISKAIYHLECTTAFGVFFRMGLNVHYCIPEKNNKYYETPPLVQIDDDTYAWQFGGGTGDYRYIPCSGDWRYPVSIDMSLFNRAEVIKELSAINFHNPNSLEGNWACTIPKKMHKVGICFKNSKCINLPLNSIKDGLPLPHMDVPASELLKKFNQGYKLDWQYLINKSFNSVHVMHVPTYVKP